MKTIETNQLLITDVTAHAVRVAVNGENRSVSWSELNRAASQDDHEMRALYAQLRRHAAAKLRDLPRREQGLNVVVQSRTGGATWVAEVYDAAGDYRQDVMRADEGQDEPHRHLAERTAREIAVRLQCQVTTA